jgi:hypothetical protein
MTGIAEVIDHMRNGGSVRRTSWGSARLIMIMEMPVRSKSIPPDSDLDELSEVIIEMDLSRDPVRWDPSDIDILANDWELLDSSPPSSVPDPD